LVLREYGTLQKYYEGMDFPVLGVGMWKSGTQKGVLTVVKTTN